MAGALLAAFSDPKACPPMFAALIRPASTLMGRLKYLEKFLLILVLFVLPLATVL